MGSASPYPNGRRYKVSDIEDDLETDATTARMHRLAQIEEIIGAGLIDNREERKDTKSNRTLEFHAQSISLLEAFTRIKDPLVRKNLLDIVQAAADHERASKDHADLSTR